MKCCAGQVSLEDPTARRSRETVLESCDSCRRFLEKLRRRQEPPHAGLRPASAQMVTEHALLARGMTSFASALAQLEGLARVAGTLREEGLQESSIGSAGDESMVSATSACLEALQLSRRTAEGELLKIEERVRAVEAIAVPPGTRDERVKREILRAARRQIEDLKPRLGAAVRRSLPHSPPQRRHSM